MAYRLLLGECASQKRQSLEKGKGSKLDMQNFFKKLYRNAQILREEAGQDLIEYVLVIAIIAFAATVGMTTVAKQINNAFANIGTKMSTYVT